MSVSIKSYFLGAVVRLEAQFSDLPGVLTDPTTITFKILQPDPLILPQAVSYVFGVDAQLVRDSVGVYHVDWTADQDGDYCYRFEGTGAAQAVSERHFSVDEGCFAP